METSKSLWLFICFKSWSNLKQTFEPHLFQMMTPHWGSSIHNLNTNALSVYKSTLLLDAWMAFKISTLFALFICFKMRSYLKRTFEPRLFIMMARHIGFSGLGFETWKLMLLSVYKNYVLLDAWLAFKTRTSLCLIICV